MAASISKGYTFGATELVTNTKLHNLVDGATISGILVSELAAAAVVTKSDAIGSNDNDTTLPTSAAVKDYVDTQVATADTLDEILTNGDTSASNNLTLTAGTLTANSITDGTATLTSGDITGLTGINTGTVNTDNLLLNGAFKYWYSGTSSAPDGWTLTGGGSVAQEGTTGVSIGSYSAKVTSDADGNYLEQEIHSDKGIGYWQGKDITVSALVYATDASNAKITVADGVGSTSSSYHAGDSAISLLTVTHTIDASATKVEIQLNCDGDTKIAYFDGVQVSEGSIPFAYTEHKQDHLYEQETYCIGAEQQVDRGKSNYDYVTNDGSDVSIDMGFPIPTAIAGKTVVLDEMTIYYNTQDNGSYITSSRLYYSLRNGSGGSEVTHDDDLGNGSSGDGNHNIIDTPIELQQARHRIQFVTDAATADDVKIYDIEVKYHCKVHGS